MVLEFLKAHQLTLMVFMSGICAILAFLALRTKTLSPRRKGILALLECSAVALLLSDRFAYLYRGDESDLGFWMVRICNFLVFFMTLCLCHSITLYLSDLFRNEGRLTVLPRRLAVCKVLFALGTGVLLLSQFTGLYYTFDAQNCYQRAPGMPLSYVFPLGMVLIQLSMVIQYRRLLSRMLTYALIFNSVVPIVASVLQFFAYGVSLTNLAMSGAVIILYVYAFMDLNEALEEARRREVDFYKDENRRQNALFEQTAEALVNAIDAKDTYTHGHSARVAMYSLRLAREAGLEEDACQQVYFAALLHDVGKIGIRDDIINKVGKLDEEEFRQIKLHPVFGNQILSSIQQSPYLSQGAHYHHERFDGRGYPDGLEGKDIPEIARIIAVADAYDAMTSKRSYRAPLPQEKVREELRRGLGTQFDPRYAGIMLRLIDQDVDYRMRETTPQNTMAV